MKGRRDTWWRETCRVSCFPAPVLPCFRANLHGSKATNILEIATFCLLIGYSNFVVTMYVLHMPKTASDPGTVCQKPGRRTFEQV